MDCRVALGLGRECRSNQCLDSQKLPRKPLVRGSSEVESWLSAILGLGEAISESDLLDGKRYPWLKGCSLAFILVASHDHHQEHLDELLVVFQGSGE